MNRFYRTAYASLCIGVIITFLTASFTGTAIPLASSALMYFGLFVFLLPEVSRKLSALGIVFAVIGSAVMLLGFLPMLLSSGFAPLHYIGYGAMLASAVIWLIALRPRTTHDDFEARFRASIIIIVVIILGVITIGSAGGNLISEEEAIYASPENVKAALGAIVPLAVILLATGILLLRGLRAEETIIDERAFNRRQLRDALIFAAIVAVVLFLDPFRHLSQAFHFLNRTVLRPVADLIAKLLSKFAGALVNTNKPEEVAHTFDYVHATDVNVLMMPPVYVSNKPVPIKSSSPFIDAMSWIFVALFGGILLYILIKQLLKLIRKIKGDRSLKGSGYPNEIRESLGDDENEETEERLSKRSRDPRIRIRYLYSEFLRLLRRKHVNIRISDTCSEIGKHASASFYSREDEVSELTDIYEHARYHLAEEPTEADADRMKALLTDIRSREQH